MSHHPESIAELSVIQQLQALFKSLRNFEERVMTQLKDVKDILAIEGAKLASLVAWAKSQHDLAKSQHAELVALQASTTDAATAAALDEILANAQANIDLIDATLKANSDDDSASTTGGTAGQAENLGTSINASSSEDSAGTSAPGQADSNLAEATTTTGTNQANDAGSEQPAAQTVEATADAVKATVAEPQ